jgi:hypothetical protein
MAIAVYRLTNRMTIEDLPTADSPGVAKASACSRHKEERIRFGRGSQRGGSTTA